MIPSPLVAPPKRGRGSGGRVFIGTMRSVPSAGSGGRSYFGTTPKTTQHAEERLVAGGVHERNRGDVYGAGRSSIIREKNHRSTERRKTTNGKHACTKDVCLRLVLSSPLAFCSPTRSNYVLATPTLEPQPQVTLCRMGQVAWPCECAIVRHVSHRPLEPTRRRLSRWRRRRLPCRWRPCYRYLRRTMRATPPPPPQQ